MADLILDSSERELLLVALESFIRVNRHDSAHKSLRGARDKALDKSIALAERLAESLQSSGELGLSSEEAEHLVKVVEVFPGSPFYLAVSMSEEDPEKPRQRLIQLRNKLISFGRQQPVPSQRFASVTVSDAISGDVPGSVPDTAQVLRAILSTFQTLLSSSDVLAAMPGDFRQRLNLVVEDFETFLSDSWSAQTFSRYFTTEDIVALKQLTKPGVFAGSSAPDGAAWAAFLHLESILKRVK